MRASSLRRTARAFLGSPTGILSLVAVLALLVLALLGPHGFGEGATTSDVGISLQSHSSEHWMGTDSLGRDIFSRTLAATRTSLLLALAALGVAILLGGLVGALIASGGPRVRRIGATLIDTVMSLGAVLLAIVVVTIVGVGAKGAVIGIGVATAPGLARYTFTLVTGVMVRDYVAAARVVGVGRGRLLSRYVGRNVADSLIIVVFSASGECIIAMAALSFLGLGVQSPTFDWGQMLTSGVEAFYVNPWGALWPAALITACGVSFALLGDAISRASNPLLHNDGPRRRKRAAVHGADPTEGA